MQDLGSLGGVHSRATSINNLGVVVGFAQTADQDDHAFVWNAKTRAMVDIGTLGGRCSYAYDVNDEGLVVGHSQADDGSVKAFRWSPSSSSMAAVDSLEGLVSYAFGVAAQGQVNGYIRNGSEDFHGFAADLSRGDVTDLGAFSDDFIALTTSRRTAVSRATEPNRTDRTIERDGTRPPAGCRTREPSAVVLRLPGT